jgi:signal transduction histidine kinase
MLLRQKSLLIIGIAVFGLFILLILFSQTVLLQSYARLERREMMQNAWRVINALHDDLASLSSHNYDWADWDDAYNFMEGTYHNFPDVNLSNSVFVNNGINVMLFLNEQGSVFYSKALNLQSQQIIPIPEQIYAYLQPNSPLLRPQPTSGIVMIASTPMLIAASPISSSTVAGASDSTLIWGRFLNSEAIDAVEQRTRFDLTLCNAQSSDLPDDFARAFADLSHDMPMTVQINDGDMIASYVLFYDIFEQPAFILRLQVPRDIYQQGQNSVIYFSLFLMGACALLTVLILMLLEKAVLMPLERLNSEVGRIRDQSDWSGRVDLQGQDEIGGLVLSINQMLETLTQSREQAERARNEAELRERVFKTLSHDVRAPLSAITLYAEMLQRGMYGDISNKQSEAALSIFSSAKQLIRFMDSLLEEAQLSAGKLQLNISDFEVAELMKDVETVVEPLASRKGLLLHIDVAPELPTVMYGDMMRLNQMLINLVTNSIKYTDRGDIYVRLFVSDADHWTLQVSDTGVGIPEKAMGHIFEPFWQVEDTKTRRALVGVGLGLSIVKQLADLMDGTVDVKSVRDEGTVFTVTLPLLMTQPVEIEPVVS